MHIKEDLARLVEILPKSIQETINEHPDKDILIEIIMDLGRRPEARFPTHPEYLSPNVITWQDLDYSIKKNIFLDTPPNILFLSESMSEIDSENISRKSIKY